MTEKLSALSHGMVRYSSSIAEGARPARGHAYNPPPGRDAWCKPWPFQTPDRPTPIAAFAREARAMGSPPSEQDV